LIPAGTALLVLLCWGPVVSQWWAAQPTHLQGVGNKVCEWLEQWLREGNSCSPGCWGREDEDDEEAHIDKYPCLPLTHLIPSIHRANWVYTAAFHSYGAPGPGTPYTPIQSSSSPCPAFHLNLDYIQGQFNFPGKADPIKPLSTHVSLCIVLSSLPTRLEYTW
jgi:hypothetical protein